MDSRNPRRFIFIDHSIVDLGGHYYEYAVHQLRAAEEAGYRPVLAVNRAFKGGAPAGWEVHPVYTYGFFFRMAEPSWSRWGAALKQRIRDSVFLIRANLAFSSLGLAWIIRDDLRSYLRRQPPQMRVLVRALMVLVLVYLTNLLRAVRAFVESVMPFRLYLRNVFVQGIALLRAILSPLALLVRPQEWVLRWISDLTRAEAFGRETLRLVRLLKPADGDIVFLPTVSEVELLGLLRCFRRPEPFRASWHLLFRRHIYEGREPDYPAQDEDQRARRNVFAQFAQLTQNRAVYFYTDTEALTAQYARLGVPFHSLPIPHTHPPRSAAPRGDRPLHFVYLGDARAEKGYHHLPRLVGDLWADDIEPGRVVFTIQSNFNVPQGEPEAVVARAQLESFAPDKVRLTSAPLSSADYRRLLLSADVVLLPYERDNYYARSSGILVEALSAGIPVIVPAGSWLAQQFAAEVSTHHQSLRGRLPLLKSRRGEELRWRRHYDPRENSMFDGILAFGSEPNKAYCWLAVPKAARYLLMSFRFRDQRPGVFVQAFVDQLDREGLRLRRGSFVTGPVTANRGTFLVPLAGDVQRIWLALWNAWGKDTVYVDDLKVEFLGMPAPGVPCPSSAVGVAYTSPDGLTAAARELIAHYPHYAETAGAFGHRFFATHNAKRVLEHLEDRSGPARPARVAAGGA